MFDRQFRQTRLGQAALASTAAMLLFVVLSAQIAAEPAHAAPLDQGAVIVELA